MNTDYFYFLLQGHSYQPLLDFMFSGLLSLLASCLITQLEYVTDYQLDLNFSIRIYLQEIRFNSVHYEASFDLRK